MLLGQIMIKRQVHLFHQILECVGSILCQMVKDHTATWSLKMIALFPEFWHLGSCSQLLWFLNYTFQYTTYVLWSHQAPFGWRSYHWHSLFQIRKMYLQSLTKSIFFFRFLVKMNEHTFKEWSVFTSTGFNSACWIIFCSFLPTVWATINKCVLSFSPMTGLWHMHTTRSETFRWWYTPECFTRQSWCNCSFIFQMFRLNYWFLLRLWRN